MKEFRIAKCLHDGTIVEKAIFKDGSKPSLIRHANDYGKYFNVHNHQENDGTRSELDMKFLTFSFNGRIKDAYETIKSGNGDCVAHSGIGGISLTSSTNVVYFLDRNIGDKQREMFLNYYKHKKFGYSITCGYKNSFAGYHYIDQNGDITYHPDENILFLETVEDAKLYINNCMNMAKDIAISLVNSENKDKSMDVVFDKYSYTNIIADFAFDMVSGNLKEFKNPNFELTDYGYKIIQCTKPEGSN